MFGENIPELEETFKRDKITGINAEEVTRKHKKQFIESSEKAIV